MSKHEAEQSKVPTRPTPPTALEAERAEQAKTQAAIDEGEKKRVSLIKSFGPKDDDDAAH